CAALRSLENGQTFFRYRGLFVIFSCNHGYKMHGHKTNSCVNGRWSRELPICVGSGCPLPATVSHGSFSMNSDSSLVEFSCEVGHKLIGPSSLYCKGDEWSSPQPVCEGLVTAQKSPVNQTLQATRDLKTKFPSHHITQTTPKNTTPHFDISSTKTDGIKSNLQQFSTVISEKNQNSLVKSTTEQTFSKALLLPVTSLKKYVTTSELTKNLSTSITATLQHDPIKLVQATTLPTFNKPEVQNVAIITKITQKPAPPSLISATSTKSNGTTANFPSTYETTSSVRAVTHTENVKFSTITANIRTTNPPVLSQSTLSDQTIPQNVATTFKSGRKTNELTTQTGSLPLQPDLLLTKSTLTKHFPNIVSTVTRENKMYSSTQTTWTEKRDITRPNPSCPDPPVPLNGAFYFRNTDTEKGYFIQYVCSTGFKLAKGDAVRYCQEGATWSGITPICEGKNFNYFMFFFLSYYLRQGGYVFAGVCLSVCLFYLDECKERLHHCPHRCINTPGSFLCSCPVGHQPSPDGTSCNDVDECAFPVAVTGCLFGCVNSPGSFHCLCPSGFTVQNPDSHCQDINECEEQDDWCEWKCINLPGSYRCICPRGYTLARDGRRCRDINECSENNGGCSHLCINRRGTFKCSCPPSHRLSTYSWSKCVPRIS
ncbi:hypothetical protein NL108_006873, partial [Boleophthalmus pectinirostris]